MTRYRMNARKGFTLIEILLTISLIALLSTLFVLNIGSLLREGEIESLENEYWRAVEAARMGAVFEQRPHFIEWDGEAQGFAVRSGGKTELFKVDAGSMGDDVEIEALFEEVAPENSYVLIRGELVKKREIATVGFFPDGTCTPYTVTLRIAGYTSEFQMDPWTGVQLVDTSDDEA